VAAVIPYSKVTSCSCEMGVPIYSYTLLYLLKTFFINPVPKCLVAEVSGNRTDQDLVPTPMVGVKVKVRQRLWLESWLVL